VIVKMYPTKTTFKKGIQRNGSKSMKEVLTDIEVMNGHILGLTTVERLQIVLPTDKICKKRTNPQLEMTWTQKMGIKEYEYMDIEITLHDLHADFIVGFETCKLESLQRHC